jgi:hypothetical protein
MTDLVSFHSLPFTLQPVSPEFPLRIIYDGHSVVIETPEALLTEVDSVDSSDPEARVWIRDAMDRTVRLRMRAGEVEVFELA